MVNPLQQRRVDGHFPVSLKSLEQLVAQLLGPAEASSCPAREYEITFPENQQGHSTEMLVMMRHMADCVINGTKPWVGVREGARVVATGLACWESLRTGKPAKVRNDF